MQELTERSVSGCASGYNHWVHPEARPLTERSLSNRRWLVLIFRSNQSSSIAQWAVVLLDALIGCVQQKKQAL